ncbi:MAG: ORF6N domain-containing protein [Proteobacteria bacterium]|nr:ORF6N domain-containing protein [Pseudomonadota bacterium]
MTNSITIVDTTITIVEYQGQRVITFSMMDKLHHRPEGTASRNFQQNKEKL